MNAVLPGRSSLPFGRSRWTVFLLAVLAVLAAQTVTAPRASAADALPVTYQDQAYAAVTCPSATACPPSEDKPQSKLWFNDGSWWGLLRSTSGPITIHRLTNHVWVDTGVVVDDRPTSAGDALWNGTTLYVASRVTGASGALRVIKMTYDTTTDTYAMVAGFPKQVGTAGSESITIARDTTGTLWITFTRSSRVWVAHSIGTDDTAWTAPYIIPSGDTTLSPDDISAVIDFNGRIGVMYSDEQSATMWFAVHVDGTSDQTWSTETVLSGPRLADDHINLKSIASDASGRIYAATKTSLGDDPADLPTDPLIYVSSRSADGTWTSVVAGQVQDKLTRPQLAIDTTNQALYLVMASPDVGGGIVYYKRSPLGELAFPTGKGQPFVSFTGVKLNNPSTTKDPVNATTGLVVLATDDVGNRYYHGELSLSGPDTTPPTAPTAVHATASSATTVALDWTAATDDTAVTGYRVARNGVQVGTDHRDDVHRHRAHRRHLVLLHRHRRGRGRQRVTGLGAGHRDHAERRRRDRRHVRGLGDRHRHDHQHRRRLARRGAGRRRAGRGGHHPRCPDHHPARRLDPGPGRQQRHDAPPGRLHPGRRRRQRAVHLEAERRPDQRRAGPGLPRAGHHQPGGRVGRDDLHRHLHHQPRRDHRRGRLAGAELRRRPPPTRRWPR